MPELPEVETVKRILETQILGKTIKQVKVYYDKILENVDKETFCHELVDEVVCSLSRKGKYLIIVLKKHTLVVHLRMEGKFFIKNVDDVVDKHEHIEFILDSNCSLRYHDTRKFGKIALLNTTEYDEIIKYAPLEKLGVDANLETDYIKLFNKLVFKKCSVKEALLDQSVIAGLGNIYVDEVLFMSKIHPKTKGYELIMRDVQNILLNSKIVLEKAILLGGTTIRSYTSSLGVTGRFQNSLLVHCREGEKCFTCGDTIKKIKVGGRGTYYCPTCQKIKPYVRVIGVTGVIGSGKTTLTNICKKLGYFVIDCDDINRELLRNDHPMYPKLAQVVKEHFPSSVENDTINRRRIRDIIFHNEALRKLFQEIVFGFVEREVDDLLLNYKESIMFDGENKTVFLSAPMLFESGLHKKCDEIIIVDSNIETMINRIMKRDNLNREEAIHAIKIRPTVESLVLKAQAIKKDPILIINDKDEAYLEKTLLSVINKISKED
ncbi:MAG: DNA-formamidopyrimidine glycosylase [Bacilli bacterium]|nr:DNA-formamidopyrimidine glycosylase [Bacilli bacterium]